MNQGRQGATHTLFSHFALSDSSFRLLRQISVDPTFPITNMAKEFMALPPNVQARLQQHLSTMNQDAQDPLNTKWALKIIFELAGSADWRNYGVLLECLTTIPAQRTGREPILALYLRKNEFGYQLEHQIPVTGNFLMGVPVSSYEQLDSDARKALKEHADRLNGFEPDLTRHPWCILRAGRITQPATKYAPAAVTGLVVMMQWQPCIGMTIMPTIPQTPIVTVDSVPPSRPRTPTNSEQLATVLPPYSR